MHGQRKPYFERDKILVKSAETPSSSAQNMNLDIQYSIPVKDFR